MSREIDTYNKDRSRKAMTYAAPGDTFDRATFFPNTPGHWHRFIVWDRTNDEDQDERLGTIREWCAANKVRRPSMRFIRAFGHPILVATACPRKAMLFKLAMGGAL